MTIRLLRIENRAIPSKEAMLVFLASLKKDAIRLLIAYRP